MCGAAAAARRGQRQAGRRRNGMNILLSFGGWRRLNGGNLCSGMEMGLSSWLNATCFIRWSGRS